MVKGIKKWCRKVILKRCAGVRFDERAVIWNGSEVIIWQQVDIISPGPVNLCEQILLAWKKRAYGNLKLRTVNLEIVSTTIQTSVTRSLNCRNSGQTNQIISHIPSRQPWTRVDPDRTYRRFIPTAFPSDPTSSIVVPSFHFVVAIAVTSLVAASDNYNQLPFFHHYLSVSIRLRATSWRGKKYTKKEIWQPYPGSRHFKKSKQLQATSSSHSCFHKKIRKKNQRLQLFCLASDDDDLFFPSQHPSGPWRVEQDLLNAAPFPECIFK